MEVSKRILLYSQDGDWKRARKAAGILTPYCNSLTRVFVSQHEGLLLLSLESRNLDRVGKAIVDLIHMDCRYLLESIVAEDEGDLRFTPRSRLLNAKLDILFLEKVFPDTPRGRKRTRMLDRLMDQMLRTVPARYAYQQARDDWKGKAQQLVHQIEGLLVTELGPLDPGSERGTSEGQDGGSRK